MPRDVCDIILPLSAERAKSGQAVAASEKQHCTDVLTEERSDSETQLETSLHL